MIDPFVSLAFSIYSNKGAYALLLGSGISRGSGVPTGWEVVVDLIRKVAKLIGEDCEPDPVAWFKIKYKADPNYSKLLDEIAKTSAERQQLLREYFEPNDDERSRGIKLPSTAHKAIAKIVAAGYVRVILTTNFDRLMEEALEEIGISPTVISTPDQVAGSLPLAHSGVTIIKLHGDYLDTRIKNTELELSAYDPVLVALVDRVVDEYGLVVCGWSAEWDVALREAIQRCNSRRFTTYWATRSPVSNSAKQIVDHRKAVEIFIRDADQFFVSLSEKVDALADIAAPHPLSSKMAVATVKRYLVDSSAKIRLRDFVCDATEKLVAELSDPGFVAETRLKPEEELMKRLTKYEAICEILGAIMIAGCHWGDKTHEKLWIESLERVANSSKIEGGLTYLLNLRRYPTLLLLYSGGIAALANGHYENFAALVTRVRCVNSVGEKVALCRVVYPIRVFEGNLGELLPGMARHYTPVSDYLFAKLRPLLREYLPDDTQYQEVFDRFEYLFGLVHADMHRMNVDGPSQSEAEQGWWGPVGCFAWRGRNFGGERIAKTISKEIEAEGVNWRPLKAGLFGAHLTQAQQANIKFDRFIKHLPFY